MKRENLLDTMSVDEKRSWLKKHGHMTGGGFDEAQGHHILWETHSGMQFKGVGTDFDDTDENLFRVVLETFFLICNNRG